MRRLRGSPDHIPPVCDSTGRKLITRRLAVKWSGRHPTVVHRAVTPVACHVPSRVLLIDVDELAARLAAIPTRREPETCDG